MHFQPALEVGNLCSVGILITQYWQWGLFMETIKFKSGNSAIFWSNAFMPPMGGVCHHVPPDLAFT